MLYPKFKSERTLSALSRVNGRVSVRAIDQLPVSKIFRQASGFYKNDIQLLREASDRGDRSEFEKLAQRLEAVDLSDGNPNKDKTIEEVFAQWKPADLQTASELVAWPSYLKATHPDVYDMLYGDSDSSSSRSSDSGNVVSDESNNSNV